MSRMGERFGPYTVHECLGAGGMAAVHRATIDIGHGVTREVALKRLLPQLADDKKLVDDFIREAKLASQLRHPNIVRILELGHTDRRYFIAMELVQGKSLLALQKLANANVRPGTMRRGPSIGVVVALLAELCDALDYASNATDVDGTPLHIVHRDLSPSNLIVTDDGHIKIIDFGVAKAVSGRFMTNTGMIKGKLGYMAIEVFAGQPVDRRTDIFSLGVVAWELLAGRRLFSGVNEIETIKAVRRGAFRAPSELDARCPPELDAIVMRALAREREGRWSSAHEMGDALAVVRRAYPAGPRDVVAWKRSLYAPPDENHTMMLSVEDLSEVDSLSVEALGSGSHAAPPSIGRAPSGSYDLGSGSRAPVAPAPRPEAEPTHTHGADVSPFDRPTVPTFAMEPAKRPSEPRTLVTPRSSAELATMTSIEADMESTSIEAHGETTDVVDLPYRAQTDDERHFRPPTNETIDE